MDEDDDEDDEPDSYRAESTRRWTSVQEPMVGVQLPISESVPSILRFCSSSTEIKTMSSETSALSFPSEPQDDESSKTVSKKAAKKEAAKQEKLHRRQEASLAAATFSISLGSEEDPLAVNYGDVPLLEIQSKTVANVRDWTKVGELDNSLENQRVLIRGRAQKIHARERKNDSVQWYHNGHKKLIFSSEMGKKGGSSSRR